MPVNLKDLPENIAHAVKLSRAFMPPTSNATFIPRSLDPRVTAWAKQVIENGRLSTALEEIADSDPDLAD